MSRRDERMRWCDLDLPRFACQATRGSWQFFWVIWGVYKYLMCCIKCVPGKKINYHRNTLIVRNVSFSVANNLYIYFFFCHVPINSTLCERIPIYYFVLIYKWSGVPDIILRWHEVRRRLSYWGDGEHEMPKVSVGQAKMIGGSHRVEILGPVFQGPKHTHHGWAVREECVMFAS